MKLSMKVMLLSLFAANKTLHTGFTTAELKNKVLIITHMGNMGNTIERSVNPNLRMMGLPSIEKLKEDCEVILEDGSPDYMYEIKLK